MLRCQIKRLKKADPNESYIAIVYLYSLRSLSLLDQNQVKITVTVQQTHFLIALRFHVVDKGFNDGHVSRSHFHCESLHEI
jgi:hypothetical protein